MTSRRALLILGIFIIFAASPASAEIIMNNGGVLDSQTVEITGSTLDVDVAEFGCGIIDAYIHEVSPGTTVSIILSRPNGETWTGSYQYTVSWTSGVIPYPVGNVTYSLGSSPLSSHEFSAILSEIGLVPGDCMFWVGYASDTDANTDGIALIDLPSQSSDACYVPISNINTLPITRIQVSTDNGDEIRIVAHYAEVSAVSEHIDQRSGIDYVESITDFFITIVSIFTILITVFKFVFVDHFVAVIVLYESVLIGYTASNSRSLIQFTKKFVKSNEYLFTIILKFISFVLDSLYKLIQAVKPI